MASEQSMAQTLIQTVIEATEIMLVREAEDCKKKHKSRSDTTKSKGAYNKF